MNQNRCQMRLPNGKKCRTRLKEGIFCKNHMPKNNEELKSCTFCCEPIKEDVNNIIVLHECKHVFHRSCLDNWIKKCEEQNKIPNCPLCRADMKRKRKIMKIKLNSVTEGTFQYIVLEPDDNYPLGSYLVLNNNDIISRDSWNPSWGEINALNLINNLLI